MLIIVGLGNLGEKFITTRHNAGFMAVDFFAKKNGFPNFVLQKKYDSLIAEKDNLLLVKPQTFMNQSGIAVQKLTTHYKLQTTNLIVIHDDIDLPLEKIKVSMGSGAGGHKGVTSIINHLKTKQFVRFRIGICPSKGKPEAVESFVIKKFTKEEKTVLDATVQKTAEALNLFINEGLAVTMNNYNG